MSAEENKVLIRHLFDEIWNKGNTALAEKVASPNRVAHGNLPGQKMPRLEGVRRFITIYRTALPDMHMTIEDQQESAGKGKSLDYSNCYSNPMHYRFLPRFPRLHILWSGFQNFLKQQLGFLPPLPIDGTSGRKQHT